MAGYSSRTLALVLAAVLIGAGLAAGGYLAGRGIVESNIATRGVTVKGVAEQPAMADLATFALGITVPDPDVVAGERKLAAQVEAVVTFLRDAGFAPTEIIVERIQVQDALANAYRSGNINRDARFVLNQTVRLRSTKVAEVRKLGERTGELVRRGIVLNDSGGPRYILSVDQLNRIKPELIRRATLAAKTAAAEFASSSGSEVGGIRTANQGVIEIFAQDDAAAERASPEKRVRAVTTVEYLLMR